MTIKTHPILPTYSHSLRLMVGAIIKFLCIGLVIVTVLLASSLAKPRKQCARKQLQYANYLEEEKDLMQMDTVAHDQDAFGSLNAREYIKSFILC